MEVGGVIWQIAATETTKSREFIIIQQSMLFWKGTEVFMHILGTRSSWQGYVAEN